MTHNFAQQLALGNRTHKLSELKSSKREGCGFAAVAGCDSEGENKSGMACGGAATTAGADAVLACTDDTE
jgi:hypothetical protein